METTIWSNENIQGKEKTEEEKIENPSFNND